MKDPPSETWERPRVQRTIRAGLPTQLFSRAAQMTSSVVGPEEWYLGVSQGFISQAPTERGFQEQQQQQK